MTTLHSHNDCKQATMIEKQINSYLLHIGLYRSVIVVGYGKWVKYWIYKVLTTILLTKMLSLLVLQRALHW